MHLWLTTVKTKQKNPTTTKKSMHNVWDKLPLNPYSQCSQIHRCTSKYLALFIKKGREPHSAFLPCHHIVKVLTEGTIGFKWQQSQMVETHGIAQRNKICGKYTTAASSSTS